MVLQQPIHGGYRIPAQPRRLARRLGCMGNRAGTIHHRQEQDRECFKWRSAGEIGQLFVAGIGRRCKSIGMDSSAGTNPVFQIALSIAMCSTCVGTFGSYGSKHRGSSRSRKRESEAYPHAYQQTRSVEPVYPVTSPYGQRV